MLSGLRSFLGYDSDDGSQRSRSSSVSSTTSVNTSDPSEALASSELDINYFNLGLCTLVPAVGTFLFGYDQGCTTFLIEGLREIGDDKAHIVKHIGTNYYLLLVDNVYSEGFVAAMTVLGALIFYPILYLYVHHMPKKFEMVMSAIFYVAGSLFVVGSGDFSWFDEEEYILALVYLILGRLLYGFGVATAFHSIPQYLADIGPDRVRGTVLALIELSIVAGLIFGTLSGYSWALENGEDDYTNTDYWIGMYSTSTVIAAGWGVSMLFLPRIPRQMMMKGYRNAKGEKRAYSSSLILKFVQFVYPHATKATVKKMKYRIKKEEKQTKIWSLIYGGQGDDYAADIHENDAITDEHGTEDHQKGDDELEESFCGHCCHCDGHIIPDRLEHRILWKDPVLYRCLFLACWIKIFEVMTGKAALSYNGIRVFDTMVASDSSLYYLIGTLVMGCTITPLFLFMEALPRRTWFIIGLLTTIVGQVVFIIANNASIDISSLAIIGMYIYFAGYEMSFGVNSWTLINEIFPHYVRTAANGVTTMTLLLVNGLLIFFVPLLEASIGMENMMYIFLGFTVIGTIFMYLFVPETRGINIEKGHELVNEKFADACICCNKLNTDFVQDHEEESLLANDASTEQQNGAGALLDVDDDVDNNDDALSQGSGLSKSTSNVAVDAELSTSTRDQGSPKPNAASNWLNSEALVGGGDSGSDVDSSAVGSDYR